jgi:hypothetical protein
MTTGTIIKWTIISIGIGLLIFIGFWVYTMAVFVGAFDTTYSEKDLVDNYKAKSNEILSLKTYINSITPAGMTVDIEYEDNSTLAIFHVAHNSSRDDNWDIKVDSKKTEILLKKLGWTIETLSTIKEKLDNANCISVTSGEPNNIGFQRSGMGKYSYNLFDKPIADSLKASYNDSCTYILYNDKVVLEYGGGVIGQQCFEELSGKK